jgi:Fungal protein of unknown function (DUF2015)
MTSDSFDIEANNISVGDGRLGLDEQGAREIRDIMKRERVKYVAAEDRESIQRTNIRLALTRHV